MSVDRPDSRPAVDCSVIVPAYNEKPSLQQLIREIDAAFANLSEVHEVVVVDDGSTDGTWKELEAIAEERPHVRAVRLRRNFGKSTALRAGIDAARGSIVVTMDGDLQDDPAEIPRLLRALDGHDRLISGWKVDRQDPLSKRLPSRLFNAVTSWVSGVKLHDHNCGYKAAPIECYRALPLYGELHRFVPAMAADLGYEVVEVTVHHRPRAYGRSKFGLERYLRGMLDLVTVVMLTRYRRRPGHLLGGLGVVFAVIGSAILTYLTVEWFVSDDPIGTRPLLMLGVLLVLVSVQLVSFGVLAELIVNRSEARERTSVVTAELPTSGVINSSSRPS